MLLTGCGARTPLQEASVAAADAGADADSGAAGSAPGTGGQGGSAGAAGSAGIGGSAGAPPNGFVSVACGGAHVCAVTTGGKVVCQGYGGRGQLGDGQATGFSPTWVQTVGISGATSVACGGEHSCALAAGQVYCWGHDENGQIGDGSSGVSVDRPTPVLVALPEGATALVAGGPHFGSGHTCALLSSGAVWCWGANSGGQIGNGQSGFGELVATPMHVATLSEPAIGLAAGGRHTCALHADGTVSCWGYDDYAQVGDGKSGTNVVTPLPVKVVGLPDKAVAIAAGEGQSCAVLASGEPRCWGQGDFGQLGTANTANSVKPIAVFGGGVAGWIGMGAMHGCVARPAGSVECAGLDDLGEVGSGKPGPFEIHSAPVVVGLHDAVSVSTGTTTSCALRDQGKLSCWGDWFGPTPKQLEIP